MSRPHDGHRPFFPLGNPFRMILPKSSYQSPKLLALLNSFEKTLSQRLIKLKPKDDSVVLSFSWLRMAMESLSETHADVKTLISELQFPASDWDAKWMHMYLDNSLKLLDICIAFTSELSRLSRGQLLLQYALHNLEFSSGTPSLEQLLQVHTSLKEWMQQVSSKNPKLENCYAVVSGLAGSLYLGKVKNSAKGKVLMRALYGVEVETIFVCSILTAALSGSMSPLLELNVSNKFSWSEAFNNVQVSVYGEIRRQFSLGKILILKDLEEVSGWVEKLYRLTDGTCHNEVEMLQKSVSGLSQSMRRLVQGLDPLSKQVEIFFHIVLTGQDALLCSLRGCDLNEEKNVSEQVLQ